MQKGILLLEDGTVFHGLIHGAMASSVGEVVFNTSMTGYQETLTDPSYAGQILVMTYPLIGNYGVNQFDNASNQVTVKGFVVRELCDAPNNFRCEATLEEFLKQHQIVAIEGIDTRALTMILRTKGAMNGAIIVGEPTEAEIKAYLTELEAYTIQEPMYQVTIKEKKVYSCDEPKHRVACYDFGVKQSMIDSLLRRNCEVILYPATASCEEILQDKPDGLFLTAGPGNPKDYQPVIEEIKKLTDANVKMFGIDLGHLLLALAMGCDTERLHSGHRGGNYPVKDLKQDRTYITIQNHGYIVTADSVTAEIGEISHLNINDNTVEGIRYQNGSFGVAFHPEASQGAMDTGYLFDSFISLLK